MTADTVAVAEAGGDGRPGRRGASALSGVPFREGVSVPSFPADGLLELMPRPHGCLGRPAVLSCLWGRDGLATPGTRGHCMGGAPGSVCPPKPFVREPGSRFLSALSMGLWAQP